MNLNYKCEITKNLFGEECGVWNVSKGKINSTQRNNEFFFKFGEKVVDKNSMCSYTSMVMALEYNGFILPTGKYSQPEDNLADFIIYSDKVNKEYKERYPVLYEQWVKGKKDSYAPGEIHRLLEIGTNEWMGANVVTFSTEVNISTLIYKIINEKSASVISGQFGNLGHIVTLVGVAYSKNALLDYQKKRVDFIQKLPVAFCIDDPWGLFDPKTNTYDCSKSGNDTWLKTNDFIRIFKNQKHTKQKWAHTFASPVSLI